MRHRILLQTNPPWIKTGLSESGKTLLKYLYKTGKYDVGLYATQGTPTTDGRLGLSPWKSFGCIPPDQGLINHINSDPQLVRNASYGAYNIDNVIKEWKPTIWVGSDDPWAFQSGDYLDKSWYKQINSVLHITIDSVPIIDLAFEQAKKSKHYLTWAKFAAKEMKRVYPNGEMNHVDSIYGAMDTNLFSPISEVEKAGVRKQFNIDPDTLVFLFVSRNQLRKQFPRIIDGFARFKKENPNAKAKLFFHTSFSEKGAGFDIPRVAHYLGLANEDILCTYTCKTCGKWWVAPYSGEDQDCPPCGAKKSGITVNIHNGVSPYEMRYVYGIADACLQAHSSGGQELNACQSLLCAKPLAITNYACGEDYCQPETRDFIYPLRHGFYDEMGTSFFKAATDPKSIADFMRMMLKSSKRDLQEIGEKSRAWAINQFGIATIGAQWEKLFDGMPDPNWASITLDAGTKKDADYQPPEIEDDVAWLKHIYKHILLMDVTDQDDGLKHWLDKLKAGIKRPDIIAYFRQVAQQENAKAGPAQDFGTLLDDNGRKRVLYIMKESIGDCLISTSLFESIKVKYPDHDLYVMTDPKYFDVFAGNPHIHKLLPYVPAAENEMTMTGAGQEKGYFNVYLHPGILTQRQLFYLTLDKEPKT